MQGARKILPHRRKETVRDRLSLNLPKSGRLYPTSWQEPVRHDLRRSSRISVGQAPEELSQILRSISLRDRLSLAQE
jgi:hypothetical protein